MLPSSVRRVQEKDTFSTKIKEWILEHIPM